MQMTIDNKLEFEGKVYRCSEQGCGCGTMYFLREIVHESGNEKLRDTCLIFQVYRNGSEPEIVAYNGSAFLIPSFKEFLKSKGI